MSTKIGVISDTHGLLRPEVISRLQGCRAILHAGDINRPEIIQTLEEVAPVYVVRGNNDKEWAEHIPYTLQFELCGLKIFMAHKKKEIPEDLKGTDLVVFGHSHKYEENRTGGMVFLNPGSCGPRRFHQPITMAVLTIGEEDLFRIERIDIPHEGTAAVVSSKNSLADSGATSESGTIFRDREWLESDPRGLFRKIIADIGKSRTPEQIAAKYGISMELTDTICRMYLTHPGIDADGIMHKMEIAGR